MNFQKTEGVPRFFYYHLLATKGGAKIATYAKITGFLSSLAEFSDASANPHRRLRLLKILTARSRRNPTNFANGRFSCKQPRKVMLFFG
jgi:hypothetical protein